MWYTLCGWDPWGSSLNLNDPIVDTRSFKDSDFLISCLLKIYWLGSISSTTPFSIIFHWPNQVEHYWIHFALFAQMTAPKLGLGGCMRPKTQCWLFLLLAVGCNPQQIQQTIPSGLLPRFCDTLQSEIDAWTAWTAWMWMYSGCESWCHVIVMFIKHRPRRGILEKTVRRKAFSGEQSASCHENDETSTSASHGGPDSWGREIFSARTLSFTDWYYRY